jgi:hypothetical protein
LAESRYSMCLGARVRAMLLRQAHATRPDARVSAMPLSKGLSRRIDFCLSAIPLGQALFRCLVAQVVVFLPGQSRLSRLGARCESHTADLAAFQ